MKKRSHGGPLPQQNQQPLKPKTVRLLRNQSDDKFDARREFEREFEANA